MKVESQNLAGLGIGAVVRVVKQGAEMKGGFSRKDRIHDFRIVPLVDDNYIGLTKLAIQESIEPIRTLVETDVEFRVGPPEIVDRFNRYTSL
jgi:hypothetical protein